MIKNINYLNIKHHIPFKKEMFNSTRLRKQCPNLAYFCDVSMVPAPRFYFLQFIECHIPHEEISLKKASSLPNFFILIVTWIHNHAIKDGFRWQLKGTGVETEINEYSYLLYMQIKE